jgi:hypothetical protein
MDGLHSGANGLFIPNTPGAISACAEGVSRPVGCARLVGETHVHVSVVCVLASSTCRQVLALSGLSARVSRGGGGVLGSRDSASAVAGSNRPA